MGAMATAVISVPYCAVAIPLIGAWSFCVTRTAAAAIKQTVRLQSTTKSPVLSHFTESLPGGPTIRAFKRQEEFTARAYELCNANIAATQAMAGAQGWFGIHIDMIAFSVLVMLAVLSIFARDFENVNKVMLSLLMTQL